MACDKIKALFHYLLLICIVMTSGAQSINHSVKQISGISKRSTDFDKRKYLVRMSFSAYFFLCQGPGRIKFIIF